MSLISNTLNSSPYFDDYSPETKDFLRVLFRPGYAVQARELNQLQAILQEQVTRFGNSIYQEGSPIVGGGTTVDTSTPQYLIIGNSYTGLMSAFVGTVITGSTSGAVATVVAAAEAGTNDPKTLIVVSNNGKSFSTTGETITNTNGLTATIPTSVSYSSFTSDDGVTVTAPIGSSSTVSIAAGIFYTNGTFAINSAQTTYLSKYTNAPSKVAGLAVSVAIIDSNADITLLDNAAGSYNYAAPGANRLELALNLVSKASSLVSNTNTNFIKLLEVRSGVLYSQIDSPQYSDLMTLLASRTYDQSGDFTVVPFNVTLTDLGATGVIQANVSPGNAYVHGYQVKKISPTLITVPKARTTKTYTNDSTSVIYGNYVTVGATGFSGLPQINTYETVGLYNRIPQSSSEYSGATGLIGTAKVLNIDPVSGSTWNLYLTDIAMNGTNNFAAVNCIKNTSSTPVEAFVINGATGAVLTNPRQSSLVYNNGNVVTASNGAWSFYARKRTDNNATSGGAFTLNKSGNYSYYSTSVTDYICVDSTTGFGVTVTGVTISSGNATVSYSGTHSSINVISPVVFANATPNTKTLNRIPAKTGKVLASAGTITNTVTIQVDPSFAKYNFVTTPASKIKLLSGTGSGVTTYPITSQNTGTNTITFNVGAATINVDTTTIFSIAPGFSISGGTLTPGYTNMGAAYFANGITGATGLGKGDIKKVVAVISDVNPPTPDTYFDSTKNITSLFNMDNGQRNSYYDFGTISTIGNISVTNPTVVLFEYYSHTINDGFFSVDSYPDKYSPSYYTDSNGNVCNLFNAIDFRGTKTSAPSTFATQLTPINGTATTYNSTYYLSRIDKIVATKDGQFLDIQGIPSENPAPPPDQDNALTLATLNIPAFTYVANGVTVTPNNISRYTMQDIGRLEKRIEDLEYYTSLSALEQSTAAYSVTDSSGNSRYKNGILVDSFNGNDSGDPTLQDYAAFIDVPVQELRPPVIQNNYSLYLDPVNSSNYTVIGGTSGATGVYAVKDYTGATGVSQPYASTLLNLNPFSYFEWVGNVTLSPNTDTWPDTQVNPAFNANSQWNTTQTEDVYVPTPGWQPTITAISSSTLSNVGLGLASTIGNWNSSTGSPGAAPWVNGTLVGGFGVSITDPNWASIYQNNISTLQPGQTYQVVQSVTDPSTGNVSFNVVDYTANSIPNPNPPGTYVTEQVPTYAPPPPPPPPPVLYVRSKAVKFTTTGLKPYTSVHFFFSGQNVDANISGTTLTTDGFGSISGTFTIPANTFTTGQNIFLITDAASGSLSTATTYAQAYYIVTGNSDAPTTIGVPPPAPSNTNGAFSNQNGIPAANVNPLAQNFFVDPTVYAEGLFINGIDLWFSEADTTIPVTLQIRKTVNGFPSNTDILYTQNIPAASVVTTGNSAGPVNATTVTFNSPVYLTPGQYSIILTTNSANYLVYAGEIGKTNYGTSDLIVNQPYVGAIYESQNSSTWVADNTKDLKFVLYICNFNTGTMTLQLSDWSASDPANTVTYTSPNVIQNSVQFDNGAISNNTIVLSATSPNPYITGTQVNVTGYIGSTGISGATAAWVKGINSTSLALYSSASAAYVGGATGLYGIVAGTSGSYGSLSAPANQIYVNNSYINRIYPGTLISGTGINPKSYVLNINPSNNMLLIGNSDPSNNGYCVIGSTGVTSLTFQRKLEGGIVMDELNIPSEEFNPFSSTSLKTYYRTTNALGATGVFTQIAPDTPHEFDVPQLVTGYGESFRKQLVATVNSPYVSPIINLSRQSVTAASNQINLKINELVSGATGANSNTISLSSNGLSINNGEVVTIGSEQLFVLNGGQTQTLTVLRGFNGTTAANVSAGATVSDTTEGIISGATGFVVKSGGNAVTRFISQKVALTANSSYLTVYFTANKPVGSYIDVYYKIKSASDSADTLENKNWYKMVQTSPAAGTFTNDPNSFVEFQFAPDPANLTSDTVPKVFYYNGTTKYTDFVSYRIKIVMYAGTYNGAINTSYIPRVSDLRIIASA